jgi:hypothetical protein
MMAAGIPEQHHPRVTRRTFFGGVAIMQGQRAGGPPRTFSILAACFTLIALFSARRRKPLYCLDIDLSLSYARAATKWSVKA